MRDNTFVAVILILDLLSIISPVDLIPDVIPVIGCADDLAVGVGAGVAALTAGRRKEELTKSPVEFQVHHT